ncbi:MAG: V-type ATP synthase subunit A [Dorea sp.]|nr:V-type ATP synthase subunit A [Dorea sp.]
MPLREPSNGNTISLFSEEVRELDSRKIEEIYGINGPVIYLKGKTGFKMSEMVHVGKEKLVGEVISLDKNVTTIQVYEETSGLRPGEEVEATGDAVSVTLAPGILNNIFDGIERPLEKIGESGGAFITRGVSVDSLDTSKLWDTHMTVSEGEFLHGGTIFAEVPETRAIVHKCMIPPLIEGTVVEVKPDGQYTIHDTLLVLELPDGTRKEITMTQHWPIRVPRPVHKRYPASIPLVTGQRILDTMFPIAKGGTAAIPGGFGTGKTMTQHQIAKWSDADIIVYIGCGERGNEMTQVLEEFGELVDPKSGNPLMDRTTLIANTSNMPVAAREASIYTGLTLAEYYRDMGYDVAIMADSTSRWAEALRELSGRLEEMPAEEGFPAYLASRLSAFYERAGMMQTLNGETGSVSIIGAVSPQGGDFSEPVTQNTKRFVRCFWGLDKSLAYARHFPAIHWLTSYSEYLNDLSGWYSDHVSPKFLDYRNRIMSILSQENSLMEIVKLIGADVLPDDQKLTLEIAKVIRLGFLQQNAFHKDDTCVSMEKQFKMMDVILYLFKTCRKLIAMGMPMSILKSEGIFEKVIAIKYDVPNDNLQLLDMYKLDIDAYYNKIIEKNA